MSDVKTYLGQKGYSIYKDKLSVKEQQWIRDELMVAPFIPKSLGYGVNQKFPIYRESKNKLYVPRYFGEETYGVPDDMRLEEPKKVDMKFTGSLRDYQTDIVGKYMESTKNGGGLLEIPCGRGKTVMALKIAANLGLKP